MTDFVHRTSVLLDFRASIFKHNPGLSWEDLKTMTSGIDCVLDEYSDGQIEFGAKGHKFIGRQCESVVPRIERVLRGLDG